MHQSAFFDKKKPRFSLITELHTQKQYNHSIALEFFFEKNHQKLIINVLFEVFVSTSNKLSYNLPTFC